MCDTNIEKQGRNGGEMLYVDHAQHIGQVTFSGTNKEQPAGETTCWKDVAS